MQSFQLTCWDGNSHAEAGPVVKLKVLPGRVCASLGLCLCVWGVCQPGMLPLCLGCVQAWDSACVSGVCAGLGLCLCVWGMWCGLGCVVLLQ